jgi:GPI mannosyltransferase 1 subunit M
VVTMGPKTWPSAALAGFCHGVAVHSKLYPIIYSLSFVVSIATSFSPTTVSATRLEAPTSIPRLVRFVRGWERRLLRPAPVAFATAFVATFVTLCYLAFLWYGQVALDQGLLYHFARVDHRHNYSMHWYWIYLGRARLDDDDDDESSAAHMVLAGQLLLLPQAVLLVFTSLGMAPYNLCLALFVQTFLFVAHNKVITAQYFTWYLCLLPLCNASLALTRRVVVALVLLLGSIVFWLGSAYCLEMRGLAVHRVVWVASVVHFGGNINVLGALLESSSSSSSSSSRGTQGMKRD